MISSFRKGSRRRLIVSFVILLELFITVSARMDWNVQCPVKCACYIGKLNTENFRKVMKIVNCTRAGLTRVPQNISTSTQALIVSSNTIRDLSLPPRMRKLEYLDASNNKVTRFDKQLQKLIQLRSLNLQSNSISTLVNGQFSGLKYLTDLDLSQNRLRYIENHAFGGLNEVQRLNLDDNDLYSLNNQWFVSMPSLKWLYLSKNGLRLIKNGTFDTPNQLDTINLSDNGIHAIDTEAFFGLEKLATLIISGNNLLSVPWRAFFELPNLRKLNLDGNPIYRLDSKTFCNLNITVLSLSYMPHLTVIEYNSFVNLTNLRQLQLHDNQKLVFIDPNAFHNIPKLTSLYIHNNRLRVLPHEVIQSLPSIKNCHFYSNLLHCDCNLDWMVNDIKLAKKTPIMYDGEMLVCYTPAEKTGQKLASLPNNSIPRTCGPTTIPIYAKKYEMSVGEELRLECHAVGIPKPNLTWMLPNGTLLNHNKKYDGRIEVKESCTLIVRHLQESDQGLYACQATNTDGYDISETMVTVINKPLRIIAIPSALNYITITWNGTKYLSMISDYQIHYRESKNKPHYRIIHLSPHSRTYTFSNLKSYTSYEFCIVYVYSTETYPVDCVNATSGKALDYLPGITSVNRKAVAAVITIFAMLFIVVCVILVVRRFKRKQNYESTEEEDTFVATQIPLENVYQPSPYMCSSRTSLIRAQE